MSYPYHRTTNAEYDDKEGGITMDNNSKLTSQDLLGRFERHLDDLPPELDFFLCVIACWAAMKEMPLDPSNFSCETSLR